MSSVVEVGSSENAQGNIANEPAKDDVFSVSASDQVAHLSQKFEQMQATEKPYQPLTEIFCSITSQRSRKYDCLRDANITNKNPTIDQCVFQTTSTGTRHSGETHPNGSVMASYMMYACQTASDTLIEGIRASVQEVLKNVPRIVITGETDRNPVGSDSSSSSYVKEQDSEIWFGNTSAQSNFSGGKLLGRHRTKTYYRPYCLLSRKYYNCQPLTVRRRKYGVSQKKNNEPGIDELTKMLDNLATSDDRRKDHFPSSANAMNRKKTLQYSPPPKYYMIRYQPSARLAGIKERSRSLNDLNLQGLRITRSADNEKGQPADNQTPTLSNVNNNNNKTIQTAFSNFTHRGTSGSQICQMVSGITKLHVTD